MVEPRFRFSGRLITGSRPSEPNPKVAPNFALRELARKDQTYAIHPKMILALQNIRNLYGHGITVVEVDEKGRGERGLCVTIRGEDFVQLRAVCSGFVDNGDVATLEENGKDLFLEARPSPAPALSLEEALETAFYVTSGFETGGDLFQQVTGNFDGAGLSFGPSQVNFGTGTLVPLFRRFEHLDLERLRRCFTAEADWNEWRDVLERPIPRQIEWADQRSSGNKKQFLIEPWRGYLKAAGRVPAFRAEMVFRGKTVYGKKLQKALQWLQTVWPHPITDLRCFCALFDLCTQQGSLDKAHDRITARIEQEKPQDQKDAVRIAVEERARRANPEWRADALSRRLGILYGAPVAARESDKTAERDNAYFSLLPEMEVQGIRQFLG